MRSLERKHRDNNRSKPNQPVLREFYRENAKLCCRLAVWVQPRCKTANVISSFVYTDLRVPTIISGAYYLIARYSR